MIIAFLALVTLKHNQCDKLCKKFSVLFCILEEMGKIKDISDLSVIIKGSSNFPGQTGKTTIIFI